MLSIILLYLVRSIQSKDIGAIETTDILQTSSEFNNRILQLCISDETVVQGIDQQRLVLGCFVDIGKDELNDASLGLFNSRKFGCIDHDSSLRVRWVKECGESTFYTLYATKHV